MSAVAALGGAKSIDPGKFFPSLAGIDLEQAEDMDDEDTLREQYLQFRQALDAAAFRP